MFLLKSWFLVTFVILSSLVSYCQNGKINGKVTSNEEVLPFATVMVGKKFILANASGEFFLSVSPGNYRLTVTHSGYKKNEQGVLIVANETITLQIRMIKEDELSGIVVLGSRSSVLRHALHTPVPVDVIPAHDLPKSQLDLNQMLSAVVPSFNSPAQTNGLTAHLNPATLRGLAPDQTLVLLNKRRRHNTATIYFQNTLGYGTASTDLNAIPAAAIDTIEILRDGAAAQYGSDAIAGVINLALKKSVGVTTLNLITGQYYKGDGEIAAFNVNRGFSLFNRGFLNLTADFRHRKPTQRNGEYQGSVYYNIPSNNLRDSFIALDNQKIAERRFSRKNHAPVGLPQLRAVGLVMNGGYPLSKGINLFWTGTFNQRLGSKGGGGAYRYPKDTTRVITELYPDGFLADLSFNFRDFSAIAGIEGITHNNWHWDVSSTYGGNYNRNDVSNSNNATQFALGKNAQTEFDPGILLFRQNTNNLNFSRDFAGKMPRMKSFTLAFGGEFRIDNFEIREGEKASYFNYAPTSGRVSGSQVAYGYRPEDAVNKNRYISAGYAELEVEKNDKLLCNLASRYEHFSDFGGNLAGKFGIRYKFSDWFLLRSSVNNGFRAPGIQQRYYSGINSVVRQGQLFVTGTYRNDSEIAAAFGIQPLQAEKSLNASAGVTSKISRRIHLTLDAYWIQIKNRVIYSGLIQRSGTTSKVSKILDSLNHREINAVRFFTNAICTHTRGIDAMITGTWPIRKSVLEILLSANFTKTNVYGALQSAKNLPDSFQYSSLLFNREERGRIEQGQPTDKVILSVVYKTGKWEFRSKNIHFGKVASLNVNDPGLDEAFSQKVTSSFLIAYSPKPWITMSAGANNVFNVYPDKLKNYINTNEGILLYSGGAIQFGNNGGNYFVHMEFKW